MTGRLTLRCLDFGFNAIVRGGLRVLAAPVLDADGVPIAALSAASPAFAMSAEAFDAAARLPVIDAAGKLSRAHAAAGSVAAPALLTT